MGFGWLYTRHLSCGISGTAAIRLLKTYPTMIDRLRDLLRDLRNLDRGHVRVENVEPDDEERQALEDIVGPFLATLAVYAYTHDFWLTTAFAIGAGLCVRAYDRHVRGRELLGREL